MTKLISSTILLLTVLTVKIYSQNIIYNNDREIGPIYRIEGKIYKELNLKKSKKRIFINDKAIDSVGTTLDELIFLINSKKIYSYNQSNNSKSINFYSLSGSELKKEKILPSVDFTVLGNQFFISNKILAKDSKKIFLINPSNWEVTELLDFSKFTDGYQPIAIVPSGTGKFLIEFGEHVGGGNDIYGFLLYDVSTDKVEDKTDEFRDFLPLSSLTDLTIQITLTIKSENHIYFRNNHSLSNEAKDEFVFNTDFKLVGRALAKRLNQLGVNIFKDKLTSYNVSSQIDNLEIVIIEYNPKYELEKFFYKIYYDSLLSSTEVKFKKPELELVKNFIFAKHNYRFDNEYYQAYFNLFEFYNTLEKRASRTKEVNHLLTAIDKKNLTLINALLKKSGG